MLQGEIGTQRATNCNIELTYEMGERSNLGSFGPNNCSNKMYSLGCFRCFRVKRSPHKNLSKLFRNCHKVWKVGNTNPAMVQWLAKIEKNRALRWTRFHSGRSDTYGQTVEFFSRLNCSITFQFSRYCIELLFQNTCPLLHYWLAARLIHIKNIYFFHCYIGKRRLITADLKVLRSDLKCVVHTILLTR